MPPVAMALLVVVLALICGGPPKLGKITLVLIDVHHPGSALPLQRVVTYEAWEDLHNFHFAGYVKQSINRSTVFTIARNAKIWIISSLFNKLTAVHTFFRFN